MNGEDSSSFKVERKSVSRSTVKSGEDDNEYIEPDDYEKFCEEHQQEIEEDKNKDLLVYPSDRLGIKTTKCPHNPYISETLKSNENTTTRHIKDIYNQYRRANDIELTRNYPEFEGYPEHLKKQNRSYVKNLPSLSFNTFKTDKEKDESKDQSLLTLLRKEDSESVFLNYLKYSGPETERIVKEERCINRHKLFHLFSDINANTFSVPPPWYKQEYNNIKCEEPNKILLEIKSFEANFLNDEPLFFEAALYDTSSKSRISENFYFNTNSKELLEKYGLSTDLPDSNDKMAKKALFTINNRINLKTVHLVFKIRKILEGNLLNTNDRYSNQKGTLNKKILAKKNKDEEVIHDICKRLSNFRQPLAYSAMPLFEDKNLISNKNSFYYNENEEESKLDQFASMEQNIDIMDQGSEGDSSKEGSTESVNKSKATILEKLNKYSRDYSINTFVRISDSKLLDEDLCTLIVNEKNKKQKFIPNLTLNITLTKIENEDFLPKRIDSSLFPVIKNNNQKTKDEIEKKDMDLALESFRESCEAVIKNSLGDIEKKEEEANIDNIDQEPVVEIQEFLPERYQLISTFSNFVNNIYVYPQLLNLTKSELRGRNIACKVMMFDGTFYNDVAEPLNTVYCKTTERKFTDCGITSICYHRREAFFNDEIKFVLPNSADFSKLHLQFIFYHVICKKSVKKENENPENIIGYAYLPLFNDGSTLIKDDVYKLPVSTDMNRFDYINNPESIKWADKQKQIFSVKIKTLTTIHPTDTKLGKYFINYDKYFNNKSKENVDNLITSYKEICDTPNSGLINYFPVIINEYFDILCSEDSPKELKMEGFIAVNLVIQSVMSENQKVDFKKYGNQTIAYVNKQFQLSPKWKLPIYIEILNIWNEILKLNNETLHIVCSGFFFEIIIKSIMQSIENSNKEFGKMNYKKSINNKFYDVLQEVIPNISVEVHKQYTSGLSLSKDLNNNLAYFLMDCLSFTDKKIIFDLIKEHCKSFKESFRDSQIDMKFDFLQIICSHEFFVPLNLPIASYYYTKFDKISTIIDVFWKRHYLVGLLLHEVFKTLKCKSDFIHIKALNTLMYILFKHSFDTRYQSTEAQERIALMYFPLIILTVDYLHETNNESNKSERRNNSSDNNTTFENSELEHENSCTTVATMGTVGTIGPGPVQKTEKSYTTDSKYTINSVMSNVGSNNSDEKNRLLGISLLYVLQNVNETVRMNWIKKENLNRYRGFILSLKFLIETFHYKGREEIIKKFIRLNNNKQCLTAKQLLEKKYNTNNMSNFESDNERLRSGYNSRRSKIDKGFRPSTASMLGSIKSQTVPYRSFTQKKNGKMQELGEVGELSRSKESFFNNVFIKMEGYLAGEAVLIILSIAEDIICDVSQSSSAVELEPLNTLFNLYAFIFEKRHCQRTLLNLFTSLKIFTNRFRHQIFIEKNPYCSQLCHIGIQYCCSSLPIVRQYCAGYLYLCMKLNYLEVRKNKMKIIEDLKEKDKNKFRRGNTNLAIKNKFIGLFGKTTNNNDVSVSTPNLSLPPAKEILSESIIPIHSRLQDSRASTLKHADIRKQSFINAKLNGGIFNSFSKMPELKNLDNQCSEMELLDPENAIGNFNRTKIQMMVALSKLDLDDNTNIKKTLATMKQYNKKDPYKSRNKQDPYYFTSEIEDQIDELMDRLYGITRDLVEIKKYEDDTEMKADYIHRVAIGFTAPDLRISFMDRLKNIHINTKYLAEAAYCSLYTAKVIFDQLVRNNLLSYDEIIPEVIWEKCFNNMSNPSDTDNIEDFSSDLISEQGFINTIKETCDLLSKAQLYEVCSFLYQLILPLYKNRKEYSEISNIYNELQTIYKNIDQGEQSGKRIFGIYYRIGFYGKAFNEIDGKEYIYRELGVTPLSEIFLKFNNLYKNKLGENFRIIQDSNKVDVSKLDPLINYVQITHVEPYFDDDELNTRQTSYERANGLNKFIFQTPYTQDGKAHGTVSTQCKRKTILYTSENFPNVKKRLLVEKREEFDLTPLEVSVEEIYERCKKLHSVIFSPIPNMKGLQMVLQGSVRIQVNSGPLEIANSFLPPEKAANYPLEEIQNLKYIFKEFLVLCQMALKLNKNMIGSDQAKYQEDLEEGFEELKGHLHKYLYNDDSNNDLLDDELIQSNPDLTKNSKYLLDSMREATKDINLFFSQSLEKNKESQLNAPGIDTNTQTPTTVLIA